MLSGLLPFGSIFIEMYFVFTSFWNYKYYYVYVSVANATPHAADLAWCALARAGGRPGVTSCAWAQGFMLLVFLILLIVAVCVTIVSTYFLLNAEDYRWHWTSISSAASTAFYVYIYAVYYFFAKTKMSGVFQTTFYFGYMLMFCIGIALVTGSIGFLSANAFAKRIYKVRPRPLVFPRRTVPRASTLADTRLRLCLLVRLVRAGS